MGVIICYLHVYLWQFSRFWLQLLSKQITIIWNATKNDINFIHEMRMGDVTLNWFDTGKTTVHMRCAAIIKILNYFIFYFLKWNICCCSKLIYKLCLIVFWRNVYQWYFHTFSFFERKGGIHILEVVARKKACYRLDFFGLFNASDVNRAI